MAKTTPPGTLTLDAKGVYYKDLNEQIRQAIVAGHKDIALTNIVGQRYIGTGIQATDVSITVNGVPGEDLAAFMAGPTIHVMNNAQDGVGNTMNDGAVYVHGMAGDVIGYGMRGGKVFIRDDVGFRVGIHMKGFKEQQPLLVIGGAAGNFLGEYQAGGCLVLLGIGRQNRKSVIGDYCATGMHGGMMFIRGSIREDYLGKEVKRFDLNDDDVAHLKPILAQFAERFQITEDIYDFHRYHKIIPVSTRPYGQMYAY